jgi:hypothetical protein
LGLSRVNSYVGGMNLKRTISKPGSRLNAHLTRNLTGTKFDNFVDKKQDKIIK